MENILYCISGWGPIRKWSLISPSPSPTHMVCSQTKITGSGIWFKLTIVWSEVTPFWWWSDQRSLPDGNGLIRGHFRQARSEQRQFRAHFCLIREYVGLVGSDQRLLLSATVWSEVTFGWHLNLGCFLFQQICVSVQVWVFYPTEREGE